MFGPVAAVWVILAPEFARRLAYDVIFGTELGVVNYLASSFIGLVIGCFIFSFPVAGGSATLRYFALLLHTRRKLPWRLGSFLDDCYALGILRVSGTAWQFAIVNSRTTLPSAPRHHPAHEGEFPSGAGTSSYSVAVCLSPTHDPRLARRAARPCPQLSAPVAAASAALAAGSGRPGGRRVTQRVPDRVALRLGLSAVARPPRKARA